jgi:hypothetical protein
MRSQAERASEFSALHQQSQPFVIPNYQQNAGRASVADSITFKHGPELNHAELTQHFFGATLRRQCPFNPRD